MHVIADPADSFGLVPQELWTPPGLEGQQRGTCLTRYSTQLRVQSCRAHDEAQGNNNKKDSKVDDIRNLIALAALRRFWTYIFMICDRPCYVILNISIKTDEPSRYCKARLGL